MSATSGTALPRTMAGRAAAASASGTASRTTSAPASASARTCASVAATSAVFVQVIDWTAMGAPPPIGTGPILTWRVRRRSPREVALPSARSPIVPSGRPSAPLLPDAELLVDDRLEVLEGLGAADQPAVDEEGRRAADPRLLARLPVGVDDLRLLARLEAAVEARPVQPDLARVALEVGRGELPLGGEELAVHLPVLPLVVGAVGRLGRLAGLLVDREREVPVDEPDLAGVGVEQVLHRRLGLGAVGALEVRELDDGDGRPRRPLRRADRGHLDLRRLPGRQQDLDLRLLL